MYSLRNKRVAIVGLGNLGKAIISRLLDLDLGLTVCAPRRNSSAAFCKEHEIEEIDGNDFTDADLLILCVKPHQLAEVARDITLPEECLVVSFLAGVSLSEIASAFERSRVGRVMTTTACCIGCGIGAYITQGEEAHDAEAVKVLSGLLGDHLEAVSEQEFVYATALASLHGAVFLLVQYMQEGMNFIGAPKRYQRLCSAVVLNAMRYRQHRADTHLVALADEVTSPGGTTAKLRLSLEREAAAPALKQGFRFILDHLKR